MLDSMNTVQRQIEIPNWDQGALDGMHLGVLGRGWIASFYIWAALCLGVSRITWVGLRQACTERLDRWIVERFAEGRVIECPFDPDSLFHLRLPFGSSQFVVSCSQSRRLAELSREYADGRQVAWVGASLANGGELTYAQMSDRFAEGAADNLPIVGMAAAAALADYLVSRTALNDGLMMPEGTIGFAQSYPHSPLDRVVLVGCGGVGSIAAVGLLSARPRIHLHCIDSDVVEASNRNRQFFTADDVLDERPKADALRRHLAELFPSATVTAEVRRVDSSRWTIPWNPDAIVSAVDNARTRLILMDHARKLKCPLVQGATSLRAAEARVQLPDGPTLDDQMFGALAEAQLREDHASPRQGNCGMPSYVTPSLFAGCFVAHQLLRLPQARSYLAWRAGGPIIEKEIAL